MRVQSAQMDHSGMLRLVNVKHVGLAWPMIRQQENVNRFALKIAFMINSQTNASNAQKEQSTTLK